MISLSKAIIKRSQAEKCVIDYGEFCSFDALLREKNREEQLDSEGNEFSEEDDESEYLQTVDIFEDAIRQAAEITEQAREEAERIRTEAREAGQQEGYDAGFQEGYQKAYEDYKAELDQQIELLRKETKSTIESVTTEKEAILEKYIDDLKKITLTIAEKVIQTSLKSSGEIIKRMIVGAAGKLKKTQWVKIYVSQNDAGMMMQGDVGLLNELSHLSGNIKIIAMEHAEDGTCIIELPEEIIDVSVNTQLENIKGILNNARL